MASADSNVDNLSDANTDSHIDDALLKSSSIHLIAMFMYLRIYFCTNFVSTLRRIKFKINILSGLSSL